MDSRKVWNVEIAKRHYRMDRWALKHFDINTHGNVAVKAGKGQVDLYKLSKTLREKGIALPVLVRFPQILQKTLGDLSSAFKQAIEVEHYAGKYIAAYPIKVNQQASVIQHFQEQQDWPIAFEVGSKAELIACLGSFERAQTIICNGYKDETYIRLALMGCMLGHEVFIVIESLTEFEYVLKQSTELDVQPKLGMRVRLTSIAKGNWQNTGGEHSKFGLTANEVLSLVEKMQDHDILACMKMLHFHMGSQIPCLQDMRLGVQEGMHFFTQLAQHGVEFKQLNIGGGLAVDYEGAKADTYFSMDYSVNDYANMVISVVHTYCEKHSLIEPTVFSENGRAMTAHHAVLLTNVIDSECPSIGMKNECKDILSEHYLSPELNSLIKHINDIESANEDLSSSASQSYKKLEILMDKITEGFSTGYVSLAEKAIAEKLGNYAYWKILSINANLPEDEQNNLIEKFIAKYFCNFSLFQSTPDVWGLKQIFPIMPLHRLDKFPAIKARIYDLTCDSDGRIDDYVEADSIQSYLSLHDFEQSKDYVLGIFLVGAYQEILGDMHNLFGDTCTVDIILNSDGSYQICDEEPGDTIAEILSYLHIDTGRMRQVWLDRLSHNHISGQNKDLVMNALEATLNENSYLN
ncbi:MAG: biosynthetic arginine decarboxylase [Gammaproteobacteria bacterium]